MEHLLIVNSLLMVFAFLIIAIMMAGIPKKIQNHITDNRADITHDVILHISNEVINIYLHMIRYPEKWKFRGNSRSVLYCKDFNFYLWVGNGIEYFGIQDINDVSKELIDLKYDEQKLLWYASQIIVDRINQIDIMDKICFPNGRKFNIHQLYAEDEL